jgi:hypothetical protein
MRGWNNVLTDTDTWRGSDGDTRSIPSGYDYVWQNSNGDMLPTNNSTFNPNHSIDYTGDWTQMKKTPW